MGKSDSRVPCSIAVLGGICWQCCSLLRLPVSFHPQEVKTASSSSSSSSGAELQEVVVTGIRAVCKAQWMQTGCDSGARCHFSAGHRQSRNKNLSEAYRHYRRADQPTGCEGRSVSVRGSDLI